MSLMVSCASGEYGGRQLCRKYLQGLMRRSFVLIFIVGGWRNTTPCSFRFGWVFRDCTFDRLSSQQLIDPVSLEFSFGSNKLTVYGFWFSRVSFEILLWVFGNMWTGSVFWPSFSRQDHNIWKKLEVLLSCPLLISAWSISAPLLRIKTRHIPMAAKLKDDCDPIILLFGPSHSEVFSH